MAILIKSNIWAPLACTLSISLALGIFESYRVSGGFDLFEIFQNHHLVVAESLAVYTIIFVGLGHCEKKH